MNTFNVKYSLTCKPIWRTTKEFIGGKRPRKLIKCTIAMSATFIYSIKSIGCWILCVIGCR